MISLLESQKINHWITAAESQSHRWPCVDGLNLAFNNRLILLWTATLAAAELDNPKPWAWCCHLVSIQVSRVWNFLQTLHFLKKRFIRTSTASKLHEPGRKGVCHQSVDGSLTSTELWMSQQPGRCLPTTPTTAFYLHHPSAKVTWEALQSRLDSPWDSVGVDPWHVFILKVPLQ